LVRSLCGEYFIFKSLKLSPILVLSLTNKANKIFSARGVAFRRKIVGAGRTAVPKDCDSMLAESAQIPVSTHLSAANDVLGPIAPRV